MDVNEIGRLKFWNVYRRANGGDWVFLDRFYWRVRVDECIDSHKKIDETYKRSKIEYKFEYE